jgi:hypothetical protein
MIIGICGFQSSGKDTIADFLIKEHNFIRLSFASALKVIVSIMFSWPKEKLEGLTKEDREWREQVDPWWSKSLKMPHLTPRFVLQHFGTELFRNRWHPDIWVKVLENQLLDLIEKNSHVNIVITDCRFENEINMLLRYQAKIVHVHRNTPEWFHKYKMGIEVDEVKCMHKSEITWIRCYVDYDIDNNGTKEDLYKKIEKYSLK